MLGAALHWAHVESCAAVWDADATRVAVGACAVEEVRYTPALPSVFLPGCTCPLFDRRCVCTAFRELTAATAACSASAECGGITRTSHDRFELRKGSVPNHSPTESEISYVKLPCALPLLAVQTHQPRSTMSSRIPAAATHPADAWATAATPPRGWTSWNAFGSDVTQELVEATQDALVRPRRLHGGGRMSSLRALGYGTVNLDDGWQACGAGAPGSNFHGVGGRPLVHGHKFPRLAEMVQRAHALGLRAGFYVNNCVCPELEMSAQGAYNAVAATAAAVRALGFDSVKVDSCGQFKNISLWRHLLGPQLLVENCFQGGLVPTDSKASIHMSAVTPGGGWVEVLASNAPCRIAAAHCDYTSFRTSKDIEPTWASVLYNLESVVPYLEGGRGMAVHQDALPDVPISRPGRWAYPDMLTVGLLNSTIEDRSHFAAWCITSSPLTLSFNLSDDATLSRLWPIVSNELLLHVNSAWAGSPGRRLLSTATHQLWVKPLGGQRHALLVLATGEVGVTATVRLADVLREPPPCAPAELPNRKSELIELSEVWDVYEQAQFSPAKLAALITVGPQGRVLITDLIAPHDSRFYLLVGRGGACSS